MLTLFRLIGWRNLLIGIMAIALILLIRRQFFGKNRQEIRVSALFDQVEFVQELKSVTYYSEEILEIGAQDTLQKAIAGLKLRIITTQKDSIRFADQSKKSRKQAAQNRQRCKDLALQINRGKEELKETKQLVWDDRLGWGRIQLRLKQDQNVFGAEVANWYKFWKSIERRRDRAPFKEAILQEVEEQGIGYRLKVDSLERLIGSLKSKLKIAEVSLATAEDYQTEAERSYEESIALLSYLRSSLTEKVGRIDQQEASLPPKLLAVVSTSVSARTDLSKVDYNVIDDSTLRFTCLPRAEVDPRVQMDLAGEDGRFSLVKGWNGFLNKSRRGEKVQSLYLDVYLEMKDALEQTRREVIYQALERGILGEADELTKNYLTEMGHALGFTHIEFGEGCGSAVDLYVDTDSTTTTRDAGGQTSDAVDSLMKKYEGQIEK